MRTVVRQVKERNVLCAAIRRRFFDTYHRDILQESAAKQTEAMQKGNARAHDGDAIVSAWLLEGNPGLAKHRCSKVMGCLSRML